MTATTDGWYLMSNICQQMEPRTHNMLWVVAHWQPFHVIEWVPLLISPQNKTRWEHACVLQEVMPLFWRPEDNTAFALVAVLSSVIIWSVPSFGEARGSLPLLYQWLSYRLTFPIVEVVSLWVWRGTGFLLRRGKEKTRKSEVVYFPMIDTRR